MQLLQEQPNEDKMPIGYWIRRLQAAERNYSTAETECLAISWSMLSLRAYLQGQRFTIRTELEPLRLVLNLSDATGRLDRWRLRLAEFDYVCEYRPGVENNVADGVSRLGTTGGDTGPVEDEVPCFLITPSGQDLSDEDENAGHLKGLWDDEFHDKIMMPEVLAIVPSQRSFPLFQPLAVVLDLAGSSRGTLVRKIP